MYLSPNLKLHQSHTCLIIRLIICILNDLCSRYNAWTIMLLISFQYVTLCILCYLCYIILCYTVLLYYAIMYIIIPTLILYISNIMYTISIKKESRLNVISWINSMYYDVWKRCIYHIKILANICSINIKIFCCL